MIFGVFRMTATMRRIMSRAFAVFAIAFALPAAAQDAQPFRHGVALFHPLISATFQPGSKTQFVFPPFADAKHQLTDVQLAAIKNAGFDFVRLPVDPGPFLQFKGAQRDALDGILRQRVQMILGAGLAVIVDFHPIPTSVDYAPKLLVQGADTPLFRDYCGMLARTAQVLDALHTNRVALELMNEPAVGGDPEGNAQWQSMEAKAYRGIRAVAPHLTLVLAGPKGSDVVGITAFNPEAFKGDPAIIYTFHYYEPYEFSHQSLPTSPVERLAADVPYPANSRPISDSLMALSARLDARKEEPAQKLVDMTTGLKYLTRYHLSNFDRDAIEADFGKVEAWAKANGIPASQIYLGEFNVIRCYGIYQGARDAERAHWLSDVRRAAEERGYAWSIWAYSGYGGMAIVQNDSTADIDPTTLTALGLR